MLDIKAVRRDPEPVLAALARRRDGSDERLRAVLELDARRRKLLPEVESLRARQNEASGAIAKAKKAGDDASGAIAEMQEVSRSETPGAQQPTDTQGGGDEATSDSPAETGANCPK